jgi:DNA-binding transcriptional ArsR family regulator
MDEETPRDVFENSKHLDARSLRGLAHPLRMHILDLLQKHGPATGKVLAERLEVSSASVSYHLRQRETHVFIE